MYPRRIEVTLQQLPPHARAEYLRKVGFEPGTAEKIARGELSVPEAVRRREERQRKLSEHFSKSFLKSRPKRAPQQSAEEALRGKTYADFHLLGLQRSYLKGKEAQLKEAEARYRASPSPRTREQYERAYRSYSRAYKRYQRDAALAQKLSEKRFAEELRRQGATREQARSALANIRHIRETSKTPQEFERRSREYLSQFEVSSAHELGRRGVPVDFRAPEARNPAEAAANLLKLKQKIKAHRAGYAEYERRVLKRPEPAHEAYYRATGDPIGAGFISMFEPAGRWLAEKVRGSPVEVTSVPAVKIEKHALLFWTGQAAGFAAQSVALGGAAKKLVSAGRTFAVRGVSKMIRFMPAATKARVGHEAVQRLVLVRVKPAVRKVTGRTHFIDTPLGRGVVWRQHAADIKLRWVPKGKATRVPAARVTREERGGFFFVQTPEELRGFGYSVFKPMGAKTWFKSMTVYGGGRFASVWAAQSGKSVLLGAEVPGYSGVLGRSARSFFSTVRRTGGAEVKLPKLTRAVVSRGRIGKRMGRWKAEQRIVWKGGQPIGGPSGGLSPPSARQLADAFGFRRKLYVPAPEASGRALAGAASVLIAGAGVLAGAGAMHAQKAKSLTGRQLIPKIGALPALIPVSGRRRGAIQMPVEAARRKLLPVAARRFGVSIPMQLLAPRAPRALPRLARLPPLPQIRYRLRKRKIEYQYGLRLHPIGSILKEVVGIRRGKRWW